MSVFRWGTLLLLAVGCASPTQVVVTIDTARCDIERFRVSIDSEVVEFDADDGARPVSIAVSGSGSFELRVEGLGVGGVVSLTTGRANFFDGEILGLNVVVGSECTSDTPCSLATPALFVQEPSPITRDCGEVVSAYSGSVSSFDSFVNACTASAPLFETGLLPNTDSAEVQLGLPEAVLETFDFRFYGEPIQGIWVSTDGVLTFSENAPNAVSGVAAVPLDQSMAPRPSVMAFWDNLRTRADGVCWVLTGTAPNRTLIVTWSGACTSNCEAADNLNFSISLEEGTHRVVLTYGTMETANAVRAQGLFATVGIVGSAPSACAPNMCDENGLCADGSSCGYSQVFAQTVQDGGLVSHEFAPVSR